MTGRDIVTASLRLIGAIAPGESLAAAEATDGLAALNRMIESWSNEGLLIHAVTEESPLTLTASDATVTMGTSGDITTRPQSIEKAVIRDGTTDYPVQVLSLDEYAAVPDKSTQSDYPSRLYDDGGYPQRTLKLWPVPSAAHSLVLWTKRALTALTLDGNVSLPPGYEKAFVYNGALEIAPEYGRQVDSLVMKGAQESLANLKRANYRPTYLQCDAAPAVRGRYNIMTGGYE